MNMKKRIFNITLVVLLLIPLVSTIAISGSSPSRLSVWLVNADIQDTSTSLAIQTLRQEVRTDEIALRQTTLGNLNMIPAETNVVIIVGHGTPSGLVGMDSMTPWSDLYNQIGQREFQESIILACHSPSKPESNIIGFEGQVDAEAGAIVIGWHLNQLATPQENIDFPFDSVAKKQERLEHPLERYLYFIHGYWGSNEEFDSMVESLEYDYNIFALEYNRNAVRYFSYFDYYYATTEYLKNLVHYACSISDFADNLYDELTSLPAGSQVNIVAHSMGGLIIREMLRLHRAGLDTYGIDIGKIITLGTPHQGSWLANPTNNWASIYALIGGYMSTGHLWPSPVFWSMTPVNNFMTTLNSNPLAYSYDIDWYTINGYDYLGSAAMYYIHHDVSDPIVARGTTHLSFETDSEEYDTAHADLILSSSTYSELSSWIMDGIDSDGDGISNDAETYYYHTDPYDSNSDDDAIGDKNEILWGYDPQDSSSPIPASSLIDHVDYVYALRYVEVYVNHFSSMDQVKFYVKYMTKTGSWTGYYYMGSDSTPTTNGRYYDSWTHPTGYYKMTIKVNKQNKD